MPTVTVPYGKPNGWSHAAGKRAAYVRAKDANSTTRSGPDVAGSAARSEALRAASSSEGNGRDASPASARSSHEWYHRLTHRT